MPYTTNISYWSRSSDVIIIHVPLKSKNDFDVFHIQLFPFSVNGLVKVMDIPASVVLIRKDFSLFATSQFSDLGVCKMEYHDLYFVLGVPLYLPTFNGWCLRGGADPDRCF